MLVRGGRELIMAVATFDVTTGQATGGQLVSHNGRRFQTLRTFSNDAPLALAEHPRPNGTSAGRTNLRRRS